MPLFRLIVAGIALSLAVARPTPVAAQSLRFDLSSDVTLDEVDAVVKGHLQRAKVLTANRRWDEVIETLRKVTDGRGDRVIGVVPGYYVRLRDYCHRRLAALPPEALKIYREQVDPQAEQWFTEATAARDERKLRMIVDQFYCSSRGDDALRLLGEIALERGDYAAARGYWEQLRELPPALISKDDFAILKDDESLTSEERKQLDEFYSYHELMKAYKFDQNPNAFYPHLVSLGEALRQRGVVGPRLAYPQGDLPAADVYARLILVDILEGSHETAQVGLKNLKALHPDARGRLGGREVIYAEAMTTLLEESRGWPPIDRRRDWPTFGGNSARNQVQPVAYDVGAVKWSRLLWQPPIAAAESDFPLRRPAEDRRTLLSYWPIVVDGRVFITNGVEIRGYDLHTGAAVWGSDPVIYTDRTQAEPAFTHRQSVGAPRFTLTAHRNRIYARMGGVVTSPVVDGIMPAPSNNIVCLDLAQEGKGLWTATPPAGERWSFEGAPLADDDFVYVAMRKGGVRPQAHVACYDAETGHPVWQRLICSAETPAQGQNDEITHNLLTVVGDAIYYNTNLGAVAALSKHTGEIRWLTTYPRASSDDINSKPVHYFRDLTPCVYDRGTLYVAPSDSEHVLALDAAAGLWRWESRVAGDAIHLLGVQGEYLFASGDQLWWIHAPGGRVAHVWPDQSPKGYGRGTIVGDAVFRPTRTTIEIHGAADGQFRREIELTTRGAQGGHLIAVDGALLIVTGTELIVFDRHSATNAPSPAEPTPDKTSLRTNLVPLSANPRVDE